MTPEELNMIITALQNISSSIEFVGNTLAVLGVIHLINNFMK